MGGRGASATNKGNIIAFRSRQQSSSGSGDKWDFRGEREQVDKLVDAVGKRSGQQSLTNLSAAIMKEDQKVTRMIESVNSGEETGDVNALLTMRRRLRQAQLKLRQKRGM